jgi:hypothetical protein
VRSPTGCALVAVVLVACGGDGRLASDSAGTGDPVSFRRTREVDLTGDRRPERFIVVAAGPRYDSLAVTLEIRSPEDSLLYTDSWDSGLYLRPDERAQLTDSAVEHRVRAQIDSVLGSTAFRPGGTERSADERMNLEGMHDAVRYDVAEDMWRRANGVPVDSSTPPGAVETVAQLARDSVTDTRVESLVAELRDRPTFRYFAGKDATYVLAWSDEERRFVIVWTAED